MFGREIELETDQKPLECIYGRKSKTSARIERWVLRLQDFDYKVVYRPGKTNIADTLSRLNKERNPSRDQSGEKHDVVAQIVAEGVPVAMSIQEVEEESAKDEELCIL